MQDMLNIFHMPVKPLTDTVLWLYSSTGHSPTHRQTHSSSFTSPQTNPPPADKHTPPALPIHRPIPHLQTNTLLQLYLSTGQSPTHRQTHSSSFTFPLASPSPTHSQTHSSSFTFPQANPPPTDRHTPPAFATSVLRESKPGNLMPFR